MTFNRFLNWLVPQPLFFGGSPPSTQSTTTTSRVELGPEQRELINLALPFARSFAGTGLQLPPETGIAGFDPLQVQAQGGLAGLVSDPNSPFGQAVQQANLAQNFALGPVLFPETNPALARATEAAITPLTEAFTQSVLPNIRSGAALAGQPGSSRQGIAEGIASGNFLRQVGDTSAQLQNEAFRAGLDVFSRGLLTAPQTLNLQTQPFSILDIIGGQRRDLSQALLTEEQEKQFNQQLLDLVVAQELTNLAAGVGGGTGVGEAIAPTGVQGPSAFQNLLGGAGLGAAIAQGTAVGGPAGAAIGGLAALIFS
ncbi:MAG: hypothetical protein GTO00_09080 [Deltaproteobacteria bacterium]|nr:hypothetical protein [Deltaproteobacteria bacterium]